MTPAFGFNVGLTTGEVRVVDDRWHSWYARHRWSPERSSTSLLPASALASRLDRWFESVDFTAITSILGDTAQIWVVPVSTHPTELVGDLGESVHADRLTMLSPAKRALAAVADVQSWLGVGQDDMARLAGYSPRSIKNWRGGMEPYPATVRRLFGIHAVVGSLIRSLGLDGAHVWLEDAAADGRARRDLLEEEDGLRTLVSEAATLLFERPVPDARTVRFEESEGPESPPQPELFSGPVRRARRR